MCELHVVPGIPVVGIKSLSSKVCVPPRQKLVSNEVLTSNFVEVVLIKP